jgi:hypothetical protein
LSEVFLIHANDNVVALGKNAENATYPIASSYAGIGSEIIMPERLNCIVHSDEQQALSRVSDTSVFGKPARFRLSLMTITPMSVLWISLIAPPNLLKGGESLADNDYIVFIAHNSLLNLVLKNIILYYRHAIINRINKLLV